MSVTVMAAELAAWLRLASLVDVESQEDVDVVRAKVDERCGEQPGLTLVDAINSVADDIEFGGNRWRVFTDEWGLMKEAKVCTGWCTKCDEPFDDSQVRVSEDGVWRTFTSPCGHVTWTRADFGEIDLEAFREPISSPTMTFELGDYTERRDPSDLDLLAREWVKAEQEVRDYVRSDTDALIDELRGVPGFECGDE